MDLKGKHILVIGLARSGMAAIRLAKKLGAARITLSESKSRDKIKEADELESMGVEIRGQEINTGKTKCGSVNAAFLC